MNLPVVFIIIPVHNREKTLEKSVLSVINQTYQNWELLIVNDNSSDGTADVIDKLCKNDSRISSSENTSYSHSCAGARLCGIDNIKGKYTAFLDSDDEWPTYHLAEFVEFLEENKEIDYVFGDIQRVDPEGNIVSESKFNAENGLPQELNIDWNGYFGRLPVTGILETAILHRFNTGMHTALFRNPFFERVRLRDVYGCEDALLTLEAIAAESKIAVCNKIHLHYLVHDENVSGANANIDLNHAIKNSDAELDFLTKYIPTYISLTNDCAKALEQRLADVFVWHIGNGIYRENGLRKKACQSILQGIRLKPLKLAYWKTLIGTLLSLR